jgi:hypothetical protein
VVVDANGYLIREATLFGDDLSEIVSFEPQKKVSFFQRTGPREGLIINEIIEDGRGMMSLRFYCLLALRHHEPGSKAEQEEQAQLGQRGTRL